MILDYERRRGAARRHPVYTAYCAWLSGEVGSLLLLNVLMAGGPFFPVTVVYAPVGIVAELWPGGLGFAHLFLLGPLLLAAYAYLATRLPHPAVWVGLACFHLTCFAVVCRLRAVI